MDEKRVVGENAAMPVMVLLASDVRDGAPIPIL